MSACPLSPWLLSGPGTGRRRRALAAWASAAGFGLVAWGLGIELPTRAEADQTIEQQRQSITRWRELTEDEHAAAVVELRKLAGSRSDLLAYVAGIELGSPSRFSMNMRRGPGSSSVRKVQTCISP